MKKGMECRLHEGRLKEPGVFNLEKMDQGRDTIAVFKYPKTAIKENYYSPLPQRTGYKVIGLNYSKTD